MLEAWLVGLVATVCGIALPYFITKFCEWLYHQSTHYKELREKEELEKTEKAMEQVFDKKFKKIYERIDEIDKTVNNRIDSLEKKMDENDAKLNARIDKIEEDLEKVKSGDQASLRNDLYQLYDVCKKKGYASMGERINFDNLYKNYHELGANGVMDDTYNKFMALPSEKVEKTKKRLVE